MCVCAYLHLSISYVRTILNLFTKIDRYCIEEDVFVNKEDNSYSFSFLRTIHWVISVGVLFLGISVVL